MVELDDYVRVSNYLTRTLAKLSNPKQKGKYTILTELYKFLFGIEMAGSNEHFLMPLDRLSSNRPRQPKLDHEQIRFLLIGGEPPVDDPESQPSTTYIIGLCQLCEIKLGIFDIRKHSKRSSEIALFIIHKMLMD